MVFGLGVLGCLLLAAAALALQRRVSLATELRVLGDSFDAPVLVFDRNGRVRGYNERLGKLCESLLVAAPENGLRVADLLRDWVSSSVLESGVSMLIELVEGGENAVECRLVGQTYSVTRIRLAQQRAAFVFHDVSGRVRLESALADSEAARRSLLDTSPLPMLLTSPLNGQILEANQSAASLFGAEDVSALVGRSSLEFYVDPEERGRLIDALRQQGRIDNHELPLRLPSGTHGWFILSARTVDVGNQRLILSAINDVTRLKLVETALRRSEQQLRQLLERTPIPILILDPERSMVLFDNRQARVEFGGGEHVSRVGLPQPDIFVSGEERESVGSELERCGVVEGRELQLRRADGEVRWFYLSAVRVEYEGREAVLYSMLDINERRQIEAQLHLARVEAELANRELRSVNLELEQQASTDRLTQAFNRRHCEELTLREMSRARRYNLPLSVILFDIDHFKRVNDTYGHAVGDSVLVELVRLVRTHLRSSDVLARWGGEEFVVVAPSNLEEAAALANKLLERVREHDFAHVGQVTVSAGVSSLNYRDTLDTLMRRVDRALYDAKEGGRDRACTLTSDALGPGSEED